MLKGKSLLDSPNLYAPNKYRNNNKIILTYFKLLKSCTWKKYIAFFTASKEYLKILKYHIFSIKNNSFFYYLQQVKEWRWKNV